jgi:hypothetical protein
MDVVEHGLIDASMVGTGVALALVAITAITYLVFRFVSRGGSSSEQLAAARAHGRTHSGKPKDS